jgi:hypothetical protein
MIHATKKWPSNLPFSKTAQLELVNFTLVGRFYPVQIKQKLNCAFYHFVFNTFIRLIKQL